MATARPYDAAHDLEAGVIEVRRGARRWRALTSLLCLATALAGCQPAPSASPVGTPGPASPVPVTTLAPTGSVVPGTIADALRDTVSADAILADLGRLQEIAAANGGNRAAGSPGHDASAEFVATELRAAGYEVELQPVEVPAFRQNGPSVLEIVGGRSFDDLRDVKAMLLSASGDVTASIHALGFDPAAQPGDRGGAGCDPSDWDAVPAAVVVLVQPGPCFRRDVIVNAQGRGVAAIVTAYPEWTRDHVLRPTLINPAEIRIPVLGISHETGVALHEAALAGGQVRVAVDATVEIRASTNVIGETRTGDPGHVVMLGGHLDSVIDGPGINDNGSGTMAILEIARRLAALEGTDGASGATAWRVRVAFWTAEEIGLLGSGAYARGLSPDDVGAIEAYLNFDMIGSPNGVRHVYAADGTSNPTASAQVAALFGEALGAAGLAWETIPLGGASDHAPFDELGIATGGLFSGANGAKTDAQAALYGGAPGVPHDACYHLPCDTTANVDRTLLGQLAGAAGWVVGRLASGLAAID